MYKFLTLSIFALFLVVLPVQAQEATTAEKTAIGATTEASIEAVDLITEDAGELTKQDEEITAEDLEVSNPTILPDSRLYFFKNWGRNVRSFLTFDPIKKTELNLRYADERLLEIKKMAEKTQDPRKIEKAMKRYEKEKEKIQTRIGKLDKLSETDPTKAAKIDRLLDKLTDKEIKHQRLLDRLEKDMPEDVREKIIERRERALEIFANTLSRADTPKKLQKRLEKIAEAQKGSKFKRFKNLEILQRIEEKVPEQAKEAIRKAQENSLKRLRGDLSQMSPEDREKFSDYIENVSGNAVRQAVILDKLEQGDISEDLKNTILLSRDRAFKKVGDKLSEIKDEKRKERYLRHLEKGSIENIKILKKLENNLDPETAKKITAVKKRTLSSLKKQLNNPQKRAVFLRRVENLNGIETFDALDEIERGLPENKRDFTREARERAKTQMLKRLDRAATDEDKEKILRRLSSDDPSGLEVFEKIIEKATPEEREKLKRVREYQLKRINKRIERTDDPKRLENLRGQIEKHEGIKRIFEKLSPKTIERTKVRSGEIKERVVSLLEEVESAILKLENLIKEADPNNPRLENVKKHLKKAKERLVGARALHNENKTRESYGHLVSALRLANNGIKILTKNIRGDKKLDDDSDGDTVLDGIERTRRNTKDRAENQREFKKDRTENRRENIKDRLEKKEESQKDRLENRRENLKDKLENRRENVVCTQEFAPVCGINGKTYSNKCTAVEQNGVRVAHKGKCRLGETRRKELDKATPLLHKAL